MTQVEALREAVSRAKAARKKLDKVMCTVIHDARADEPLIELRFALIAMEAIAATIP
jgi:collagenase-like PrtC family protease